MGNKPVCKRRTLLFTDDPIERKIVEMASTLSSQNDRLKKQIEKSGAWAAQKHVDQWRPFDFLHYFNDLYEQRYRRQYHLKGSLVRAYDQIEKFMREVDADNKTFKSFIDLAFARHFNDFAPPTLQHIINKTIFSKVMKKHKPSKRLTDLDHRIAREAFIEDEQDPYAYLDEMIANECLH